MAKILIVDDERAIRDLTAAYLRQDGHQTAFAASGPEALTLLRAESWDMVISDFQMPAMTGAELAAESKRLRPDLPILIMSGRTLTPPAHTDGFLQKPFTAEELKEALATCTERHAA